MRRVGAMKVISKRDIKHHQITSKNQLANSSYMAFHVRRSGILEGKNMKSENRFPGSR